MSHYKPIRELLATDVVILNLGKVTRITPELGSHPSSNYHINSETQSIDRFNVHRSPLHGGSLQWHQDLNPQHFGLEFVTIISRLFRPHKMMSFSFDGM
ncbi:hypothetical protein TNCV_646681 [Trichonephila clavipes]|nr:hypothetical protein TNCV_646681 [Trichonephila clavipes]